jgi:hypothetical protein
MRNPILLFTAGLLKRSWALLSCAVFTVIGVYAAATNKANSWTVGATAVAAVAMFIVAAYLTWKDEHGKYTAELARNQRPDIQGEVGVSGYGINTEGQEHGRWSVGCEVVFNLTLCNHRPISTTLQRIECDGSQLKPPVVFRAWSVNALGSFPIGTEMPQGIGKSIDLALDATIDGVRWDDVHPIDLAPLRFYVIDAFGEKHLLKVSSGNRLFPERP